MEGYHKESIMAFVNKVFLMGNLTRDPQLSYLPSQTAVTEFGLAVNRRWVGKDGQKKEDTCFVDCRIYGKQAETLNKYMTKGRPLFIEGRLDFDSWTAQDGSKRSKHRITVESFQFVDSGSSASDSTKSGSADDDYSQSGSDEGSDDIPF